MKSAAPWRVSVLLPGAVILSALAAAWGAPGARAAEAEAGPGGDLRLFPRVRISIEGAFATRNPQDTRFLVRRRTHARVFSWGRAFLDFVFLGEDVVARDPVQINHEFEYVRAGWRLGGCSLLFYWHHRCNNALRDWPGNRMHWNDYGLGLASATGFDQERPDAVSWKVSAGRMFMLSKNRYQWGGDIHLRANFGTRGATPYFDLRLDWTYDDRGVVMHPQAAVGYRVLLGNGVFLKAFLRWEYLRDGDGYRGRAASFATVGLEAGRERWSPADRDAAPEGTVAVEDEEGDWMAVEGLYAHVLTQDFGYVGDVRTVLRPPLRWLGSHRLTVDLLMAITTPPQDMFPNSMLYRIEPRYCLDVAGLTASAGYGYWRRDRVGWRTDDWDTREAHVIELALARDLEEDEDRDPAAAFCFRPAGSAGLRLVPLARGFGPWGGAWARASVEWFRWKDASLYALLGVAPWFGREAPFGLEAEAGLRLRGEAGSSEIYLRYQRRADPFRFRVDGEQALLGLRLRF